MVTMKPMTATTKPRDEGGWVVESVRTLAEKRMRKDFWIGVWGRTFGEEMRVCDESCIHAATVHSICLSTRHTHTQIGTVAKKMLARILW